MFAVKSHTSATRHTFQSNKTILGSGFINNSIRMALNTIFMCVPRKGRLVLITKKRTDCWHSIMDWLPTCYSYSYPVVCITHSVQFDALAALFCVALTPFVYAAAAVINCTPSDGFSICNPCKIIAFVYFSVKCPIASRLTFDVVDLIYSQLFDVFCHSFHA